LRVAPTFAAALLLIATTAAAQNYPLPGSKSAPLVICTGCPGGSVGLPTYPYGTPLVKHVGRIVDSFNTISVQNAGMRTVRARAIRVAPGRNRLYIALGEAVGAYKLDTFFTGKLPQGMVAVNTMVTGSIYQGRSPLERVAKPDSFFYAEAKGSGWITALIDSQKHLNDFDVDDRGYLYVATVYFGWGIHLDPGTTTGAQLPPVLAQVADEASTIVSLKSGTRYYVYLSGTQKGTLYDVTDPVLPSYVTNRLGTTNTVLGWAKYEAGSRVAFLNGDGHVRVYTNDAVVAGGAPLADVTPAAGKKFADLSFDDDGNLWLAEAGTGTIVTSNLLWRLTPTGDAYAATQLNVYGSVFAPTHIHASAGYIALAGRGLDGGAVPATELRLLKMVDGVPQLLDTDNFFRKYYHAAPAGYAQPVQTYMTPKAVRIMAQGGHTYLIYNANGLGDVFEIGANLVPDETLAAPAQLFATALGTTVTLNWTPVVGATGYEVSRRAADGSWLPLGVLLPPFADPGRTADTTYAYRVRAVANTFQASPYAYDVATTGSAMALVEAGMTVDAIHVSTLRDRVNSMRLAAGLTAFSFTDGQGGGASIRASHIHELRTALNEARLAIGMTEATFTDPTVSQVRAVHVNEIIGVTE
jgi:hypothetical protein